MDAGPLAVPVLKETVTSQGTGRITSSDSSKLKGSPNSWLFDKPSAFGLKFFIFSALVIYAVVILCGRFTVLIEKPQAKHTNFIVYWQYIRFSPGKTTIIPN